MVGSVDPKGPAPAGSVGEVLDGWVRPNGLLYREIDAQIDAAQQRVAQTLALLSPKDTMVHIFKALRSPNSPHRDQARELLRRFPS